uniref:methionine synthase-like n=1 Tax=Styela clava TaxID=7725 RepID=UPI00193AD0CF|nr:methionine synthase-like [Styela clava]
MILHDECTVEEMKQCVESAKRKEKLEQSERSFDSKALLLSGSNVLRKTIGESGKGNVDEGFSSEIRNSLIIGQRCDIANIAKFREIILKIAKLNDEICKDIGDEKPVLTPEGNSFIYAFHGLLQLSKRLANTLQRNPDIFENNLQRLASIQVEQDKALEIARSQIAMGADVINLLFDPISYNSKKELPMPSEWMKWFINLAESDYGDKKSTIPVCSIPLCINSGKIEVILEGLKYTRGRAIANYLSFYNGKEQFIQDARLIKKLGPGAIIAFAQDYKEAPARTPEKKANLCIEMFKLLVETVGFHPNEVILDPVVTRTPINSQPGANEFGETFFEAISLIRTCSDLRDYNVRLIGGITAVSQFYRGYSKTRIDLNGSFLKHCLEAGMHHVIMEVTNIAHEIKQNLVEDLVTNKDPEAKQKLKAFCCAENYEKENQ